MSLEALRQVIGTEDWEKLSTDDQLQALKGGFGDALDSLPEGGEKDALYSDYVGARQAVAKQKVVGRLGDDTPRVASAMAELLQTGIALEELPKKEGVDEELPSLAQESVRRQKEKERGTLLVRHLEALGELSGIDTVNLMTTPKDGSEPVETEIPIKDIRNTFDTDGAGALNLNALEDAIIDNPNSVRAKQEIKAKHRDLMTYFDLASTKDNTEFQPYLADEDNPEGLVQVRKKKSADNRWEVLFPDGSVEDISFGKEQTTFRSLNDEEKSSEKTAEAVTRTTKLPLRLLGSLFSDESVGDVLDATFDPTFKSPSGGSTTDVTEGEFSPAKNPVPSQNQMTKFIGQFSDRLEGDQRRQFESIHGSRTNTLGSFGGNVVNPAFRAVVADGLEGLAGVSKIIGAELGQDPDTDSFEQNLFKRVAGGARLVAPVGADAGVIGTSTQTISGALGGLTQDILVGKGAGKIVTNLTKGAKVAKFGKNAGKLVQTGSEIGDSVGKAAFALSASTKITGSTYADSYEQLRGQGMSKEAANEAATKEALTMGAVTAILERASPAEVFLSPATTRGLKGAVTGFIRGGTAEGVGQEAPQAIAGAIVRDMFREDGSTSKEIHNFRRAFGGDLEAFKSSEIIQGIIGGFGAGAPVAALQGATGTPEGIETEPTHTKADAEIKDIADLLVEEATPAEGAELTPAQKIEGVENEEAKLRAEAEAELAAAEAAEAVTATESAPEPEAATESTPEPEAATESTPEPKPEPTPEPTPQQVKETDNKQLFDEPDLTLVGEKTTEAEPDTDTRTELEKDEAAGQKRLFQTPETGEASPETVQEDLIDSGDTPETFAAKNKLGDLRKSFDDTVAVVGDAEGLSKNSTKLEIAEYVLKHADTVKASQDVANANTEVGQPPVEVSPTEEKAANAQSESRRPLRKDETKFIEENSELYKFPDRKTYDERSYRADLQKPVDMLRDERSKVDKALKGLAPAALTSDGQYSTSNNKPKTSNTTATVDGELDPDMARVTAARRHKALTERKAQIDFAIKQQGKAAQKADPTAAPVKLKPTPKSKKVKFTREELPEFDGEALDPKSRPISERFHEPSGKRIPSEQLPNPQALKKAHERKQLQREAQGLPRQEFSYPSDNYSEVYNNLSNKERAIYFSKEVKSPEWGLDTFAEVIVGSDPHAGETLLNEIETEARSVREATEALDGQAAYLSAKETLNTELTTKNATDTTVFLDALEDGDEVNVDGVDYTVSSATENSALLTDGEGNAFDVRAPQLHVESYTSALDSPNAELQTESPSADAQADATLERVGEQRNAKLKRDYPTDAHSAFFDMLSKFLGRKVVLFTSSDSNIEGFVDPSDPNTIFINTQARQPIMHLVGHETAHTLESMNDYAAFAKTLIDSNPKEFKAYKKRMKGVVAESDIEREFVADFVGSRFTDHAFWKEVSENAEPSVFQDFAKSVRKVVRRLINLFTGENFRGVDVNALNELDRLDTMLTQMLSLSTNQLTEPELTHEKIAQFHFSDITGLEPVSVNPQSFGFENDKIIYEPANLKKVEEFVKDTIFNPETATPESAVELLDTLTDPVKAKALQDALVALDPDYAAESRSTMVIGAAQAAYINYAVNLFKSDPATATRLINKAQLAARDIRVYVDSFNASEAGRFLRSLRAFEGGSLMGLLAEYDSSKSQYIQQIFKIKEDSSKFQELLALAKTSQDTKLDSGEKEQVFNAGFATLNPDASLDAIKEAEAAAYETWDNAIGILEVIIPQLHGKGLTKFSELEGSETPSERLVRLVKNRAPLGDIAEASRAVDWEGANRVLSGQPAKQTRLVKLRDTAQSDTQEVLDLELDEFVDRTTDADSEIDVIAKNLIVKTKKWATVAVSSGKTSVKQVFDALRGKVLKGELTSSQFRTEFEALGGSPEISLDTFYAIRKDEVQIAADKVLQRNRNIAEGDEARAERDAAGAQLRRDKANDRVVSVVSKLQFPKGKTPPIGVGEVIQPNVDTNKDPSRKTTLNGVVSDHVNPKNLARTPESLREGLERLKNADGTTTFEADQVEQLVKTVHDARIAALEAEETAKAEKAATRERRAAQQEERASLRLFQQPKTRKLSDTRSLKQIVIQDWLEAASIRVMDARERRSFLERILTEKRPNLQGAAKIKLVNAILPMFEKILFEAKVKAVAKPLSQLVRDQKISSADIDKIIKTEVLDPTSDILSSIAAVKDWRGLTRDETMKLAKWQAQIDQLGRGSRVAVGLYFKQMRLILKATGLKANAKKFINSYIRAAMYSGLSSQIIGFVHGTTANGQMLASQMAKSVYFNIKSPALMMGEISLLSKSTARNIKRFLMELRYAALTGTAATAQLHAAEETKNNARGATGEVLFLDSLTQVWDSTMAENLQMVENLKTGKASVKNIHKAAINMVKTVASSQLLVFRALGSVDSAMTKFYQSVSTDMEAFRQAKEVGFTPAEFKKVTDDAQTRVEAIQAKLLADKPDITPLELSIEVADRVEGLIHANFKNVGKDSEGNDVGVDVESLRAAMVSDLQDKIGTGQTSNSWTGQVTSWFSNMANGFTGAPLLLRAIRTTGNVADYQFWGTPIGAFRMLTFDSSSKLGVRRKTLEEVQKIFPNIKHELTLNSRYRQVVYGNGVAALTYALIALNDDLEDDEKYFYFTGAYPLTDPVEQARWKRNGWRENTLILGKPNNKVELRVDRGITSWLYAPLAVSKAAYEYVANNDAASGTTQMAGLLSFGYGGFFQSADTVSSMERLGKSKTTTDLLMGVVGSIGQSAVPYSSLAKTAERVKRPIDTKDSDLTWADNLTRPFWLDHDKDGVVTAKNFLGEEVGVTKGDFSNALTRMNFPLMVDFTGESRRDPVAVKITKDMAHHGYAPRGFTTESYKTFLAKRELEYSSDNFQDAQKAFGETFKKEYKAQASTLNALRDDTAAYKKVVGRITKAAKAKAFSDSIR